MNHCVPDTEVDMNEFDVYNSVMPSDLAYVKSKWISMQQTKKSVQDDMAYVPEHFSDSGWVDIPTSNQQCNMDMPGKVTKQHWGQQDKGDSEWISANHVDGDSPTVPEGTIPINCDSEDHPVGENHVATNDFRDNELESWLQYPLDDLDHAYNTDMWGDFAAPTSPVKDLPTSLPPVTLPGVPHATNTVSNSAPPVATPQSNRAANAAAALALGAQRAAGLIPSISDAFNKVRASTLPTITTSHVKRAAGNIKAPGNVHPNVTLAEHFSGGLDTPKDESIHSRGVDCGPPPQYPGDWSMLQARVQRSQQRGSPPSIPPSSPPGAKDAPLNFSHFSRPAAIYSRANLQNMGAALSGAKDRMQTAGNAGRPSSISCNSSVAESTMVTGPVSSGVSLNARMPKNGVDQGRQTGQQDRHFAQVRSPDVGSLPKLQKSTMSIRCPTGFDSRSPLPQKKMADEITEQGHASTITSGGPLILDKRTGLLRRGSMETTGTSSCGGESSGRPGKEEIRAVGKGKRAREEETDGANSEDIQDDSLDAKKPTSGRASAAKRSRAAEVHNLSERRRRDRINERMKALQELIPNSNKTDKASMLDEAIEYLKMLQLQLQVMSMRSGVGMSPMLPGQVMPNSGMPPQLPMHPHSLPPVPQGMSMGGVPGMGGMPNMMMAMGGNPRMGFGDMPNLPAMMPPHPSQQQRHLMEVAAYGSQGTGQPAGTPRHGGPASAAGLMDGAHPRQSNTGAVDPLAAYLARQQHMHSQQASMNMDMYQAQAYLLQQQQQALGQSRQ